MREAVREWFDRNWDEGLLLLRRMVRSPSLPGCEAEVQRLVAAELEALGFDVEIWEPSGEELLQHPCFNSPRREFRGSPNVAGVLPGSGGGRSLVLNGHVDVVPVGDAAAWSRDPFSGALDDGRLYGRGSTDMKGGNAAMLMALRCLQGLSLRLSGAVIFQSVVEEESGGAGTLACLLKGYRADAALVPEPSQLKIFRAQQGSQWFRISVAGRSAHGGTRYEGISAIEKTELVLQQIRVLEQRRNHAVADPLYRGVPIPFPINVGTIQGGEWPSSVPDQVVISGRMGVAPDETLDQARAELTMALQSLPDEWLSSHPPELEWFGAAWLPNRTPAEHPLLEVLASACHRVLGQAPQIEAAPWGTDAGLLNAVGAMPALVFGPGVTALAHKTDEYVLLADVRRCAEIYALTIADWCGCSEPLA